MKTPPGFKTYTAAVLGAAGLIAAIGVIGKPYMDWATIKLNVTNLIGSHNALASEFKTHVTESNKVVTEGMTRLTKVEADQRAASEQILDIKKSIDEVKQGQAEQRKDIKEILKVVKS